MLTGILYALLLIGGFIVVFAVLDKKGLLEKHNLELSGPLLMWKTEKGKKLIERIAQKKGFWTSYGNVGIVILGVCMVAILYLVVWSAYLASSIPAERAPSPRLIIGIPGVNPLIPVWYGILGLAVAIIVHEFSHGILARVADIKVKTLGLVFLVVPIGAFVEPDEDEMNELPKLKRDRIYSVGPTTNILLALVCVLLFTSVFMGAVAPRENGVIVNGIVSGSPAHLVGVSWGEMIIEIDGERIESLEGFYTLDVEPGGYVDVRTLKKEEEQTHQTYSGIVVANTLDDYPADEAGLETGDVLISLNNETIRNLDDFQSLLDNTSAGQEITIVYHRWDNEERYEEHYVNLTLADKYEGYAEHYPHENREEYKGQGYLGVGTSYMGLSVWDSEFVPRLLGSPLEGSRGVGGYMQSGLLFISLPFLGLSPLPSEITALYEVTGPVGVLPSSVFWVIANSLYWVFWLNLMVGLFNALPAVPLDGGYVFKDGLSAVVEKTGLSSKTGEKVVNGVVYMMALIILGLIMWQLVGPRL